MPGDKVFFDTNVLLYILSDNQLKADKAEELLGGGGIISVQVLNEFTSAARLKMKLGWAELNETLAAIRAACQITSLDLELHERGLRLAERYGYSIYDSMIVSAALISGCDTLYSEDFQNGQVIGSLTVQNPFI